MKRQLSPLFSWRSAVVDSGLDADTKHVGLTLSLHMNERGGSCFPSLDTLATETSRSKKTIVKALRLMRELGWLTIKPGGGRGKPNVYTAAIPETVSQGNGLREEKGFPGKLEDVLRSETSSPHPRKPRPRDPVWDALVDVFGEPSNDNERGRRNKVVKLLRQSLVGCTDDYVTEEIKRRHWRWSRVYPGAVCTDMALANRWSELAARPTNPAARAIDDRASLPPIDPNGLTHIKEAGAAIGWDL